MLQSVALEMHIQRWNCAVTIHVQFRARKRLSIYFYLSLKYSMTTKLRHAGKTQNLAEKDMILSSRRHSPVQVSSGWCSVTLVFTVSGTFITDLVHFMITASITGSYDYVTQYISCLLTVSHIGR